MESYDIEILRRVVKLAVRRRLREINEDKKWVSGRFDANGDWIHASEFGGSYQKDRKRSIRAESTYGAIFRTSSLQIFPEGATGYIHKPTVTNLIVEALIIFEMWVYQEHSVYNAYAGWSESELRTATTEQYYDFKSYQSWAEWLEKTFGTRDQAEIERMFYYLKNCRYNCR
jgi:hypothetical protein